jgi:hypothetical protein
VGIEELATRDVELGISPREVVPERELATIELRPQLPALGESRPEARASTRRRRRGREDGGDDRHEDQAT